MAQPRIPAWDTPGLPAAAPEGFQDRVPDRSTLHQISMLGGLHILGRRHHPLWEQDKAPPGRRPCPLV
jgi:hypothetical protein